MVYLATPRPELRYPRLMDTRTLGSLFPVSSLTLGGGGIGQVWGPTIRAEAVATVREAVESGINLLDMAASYGPEGEAERVVGEAFEGHLPPGIHITTKCRVGNPLPNEVYPLLSQSLGESLSRLRLERVDLFFLHNMLADDAPEGATTRTSLSLFFAAVIPAFERLRAEGRIGAWGITGIGEPAAVIAALESSTPPAAVQCVANLLDSPGGMKRFEGPSRPREIIAAANRARVGVMGIRAVQAGALTSSIDRDLPPDHPEMIDFERATPFRTLAKELGKSPAYFAHQYALAMEGVDTVVLGVKNRVELRECLAAAAEPMPDTLRERIDLAVLGR